MSLSEKMTARTPGRMIPRTLTPQVGWEARQEALRQCWGNDPELSSSMSKCDLVATRLAVRVAPHGAGHQQIQQEGCQAGHQDHQL